MTVCAVCHRGLSNATSVSRGTGPVCDRHVNRFIQQIMVSEIATRARESWARAGGRMIEVREQGIRNARARFLSRLSTRSREIPVETGSIDLGDAPTRRRQSSEITFERFDSGAVMAHSGSDEDYLIVTNQEGRRALGCSCPSFVFRREHDADTTCRHMDAYNALADVRRGESVEEDASARTSSTADAGQARNRIEGAPTLIRWIVEEEMSIDMERDAALHTWHERHQHDGVLMSQDDTAFANLLERVRSDIGGFETNDVLDGSDHTFGIELELEFESPSARHEALRRLNQEGIASSAAETGYHSRLHPTLWTPQRDGSLREGFEIISPVLRDTPEEWERIHRMMEVLNESGGLKVSRSNGLHIHLGNQNLDDRGYRWQRLARYLHGYSKDYYRMGGARQADGRNAGHRGEHYAKPLKESAIRRISKSDTALEASQKLIEANNHGGGNRYHMVSTHKMVNAHVPTVEFRYPNATYDARILQRQVQLANLTMMQSAYLRKNMPGSDRLPKLFSHDTSIPLSEDPTMRFRQFLDTLGSDRLRSIAASLWVRGE